jgi:uncharacterized protein YaiE (UPF0345 family)
MLWNESLSAVAPSLGDSSSPANNFLDLHHSQTIAFIDSTAYDSMALASDLQVDAKFILDPTRDGISQITEILGQYQGVTGINIIAHGGAAELQLGSASLSARSLQKYTQDLQQWKSSLAPKADILFYACNVAEGEAGQAFVKDLSNLTGADIAASTDLTGDASQGGDWNLEYSTGEIETATPFTSSFMNSYHGLLPTLFTNQIPVLTNLTDGTGAAGDYELGMEFTSTKAGKIDAIRYYKAANETGPHVGSIWSSTGTLLGSTTFANETASGWQQQALPSAINVAANTTYVVSVNANTYYVATSGGLASTITNGDLSAVADNSNGVFNFTPSSFPTQSFNNTNYFRDIVFTPTINPNNTPGAIAISGTPTQNAVLTANVTDVNGLTGVTINYQWQQSTNGTTWTNIDGAINKTLSLAQAQVGKQVRSTAAYVDALGTSENVVSSATNTVANVNDLGSAILAGSAAIGSSLQANILDADGLGGVAINYRWQQLVNSTWTDIAGATAKSLTLGNGLLGQQVRAAASYTDALSTNENIFSSATNIAAQNTIVLENQKAGTAAWRITNLAANNEILGYGDATSVNKGQTLNLKVSLAQAGQYQLDVYRLGYYGGAGGRLVTSVNGLNGLVQAAPTVKPSTKLIEYNWNTSYALQTGTDWTTGLYEAKLTNSTGKQTYVPFVVRDDNRPADLGFQDAVATAQAYNNFGGSSVYDANSPAGRAFQVSFDRPYAADHLGLTSTNTDGFNNNNMLSWEYNMTRWLESQGYDVSYFTNLDVSTNPLQLYSQKALLLVGHDEYWSKEERNNIEQARDNGINLASFSANTGYWQVRFDPSSTGQANRVLTIYKDSSGIGTNPSLDPIAQSNPTSATTLFRSPQVNRPENALLGVGYTGDTPITYGGFDFVVSNAADPYYANTGLNNGDKLVGLVGYEWDSLLNNGAAPAGLVTLSRSPVPSSGLGPLGLLPPGTDDTISNSVRYTAPSGAKVFSSGSVQWAWGLDSDGVTNPRVDPRVQQITVNILADMGARPKTPNPGIIVPPTGTNPNNTPGTIALSGIPTQNQVLTANVSDVNGLTGVTINYQWQQSSNGTTWTDITGATNKTLTLAQPQVGLQVRSNANYIDALGTSENITSTATTTVLNVNDVGTVAISGIPASGNTLIATVTDLDGLTGVTIGYQWQRFVNNAWVNIAGAIDRNLTLNSSFVGQQVRVNTTYADALGGSESIFSLATNIITAVASSQSLFAATTTPTSTNLTDGTGAAGDYELGMEFTSTKAGQINAIRYYKAASETGTHVGKIWSSTGTILGSVTFANETASGWQQQSLPSAINIAANTTYVVSVNANTHYVATSSGLASTITNGDLSAVADGSNGVFNFAPNLFPTQSFNNANYFRDVVFTPTANSPNTPGTISLSGTPTQNQVLTANVADLNGLAGVTISYQWQQSTNGATWTNINGATSQTLTLTQAQVGNQVRSTANYIDALGTSENITSTPTTAVLNINDVGTVAISGTPAAGNALTATVTDLDGLTGVTIGYQWQRFVNNAWANVAGANSQTLALDSSFVGQQVRVATTYTDALGGSENIFSLASNTITSGSQSIFVATTTPASTNLTDGTGAAGDYELGMEFTSAKTGQINAIRYYKAPSETGTHVGKIWSSTGTLLGSVTFTNETASGWQQQALPSAINIAAGTKYIVSVNANTHYVATSGGLATTIINGDLSAVADGSNGVFSFDPNLFPTQSFNNANYFRDVVFIAA